MSRYIVRRTYEVSTIVEATSSREALDATESAHLAMERALRGARPRHLDGEEETSVTHTDTEARLLGRAT